MQFVDPVGPGAIGSGADGPTTSPEEAANIYGDKGGTLDYKISQLNREYPGLKGIVSNDTRDGIEILFDPEQANKMDTGAIFSAARALLDLGAVSAEVVDYREASHTNKAGYDESVAESVTRPDFEELFRAKSAIRRFLFETSWVSTLDIDDINGVIVIGISDASYEDKVRSHLTKEELEMVRFLSASSPEPFVSITSVDNYMPAGDSKSSILPNEVHTYRFRPLVGSADINYPRDNLTQSGCTLGPRV